MGTVLSLAKLAWSDFLENLRKYQLLKKRLQTSPGLPVPNPTLSFWTIPPSPLVQCAPSKLPNHADFVVIGSGITGTSLCRALLDQYHSEENLESVKVVMLEARDVCSGATGRNGGHISPPLYHDYITLKEEHGEDNAKKMIKFRLAHVEELGHVAEEEDILKESQWRGVETVDVFYDQNMFDEAKSKLQVFREAMPVESEHYRALESEDAKKTFKLASDTVGCISTYAGAIHPYRFVTGILSKMIVRYSNSFSLCTHTPCTSIVSPTATTPFYTVNTPRGTITTPHVIHATNGWSSYLLEPMRAKIIPVRGNMSAQRPGQSLDPSTLSGQRSFVFYTGTVGYDYLTQLPTGENELMLGGGFARAAEDNFIEVGNTDDSEYSKYITSYISGVLPRYFGDEHWGAEKPPAEDNNGVAWGKGRVKALWSGVLGISADLRPWVGRLPQKISGRVEPPVSSTPRGPISQDEDKSLKLSAAPGEWIAAGYTGEGMVHAWLSGKALAHMVMDRAAEIEGWFPDIMKVTERRWVEARPEKLLEMLTG